MRRTTDVLKPPEQQQKQQQTSCGGVGGASGGVTLLLGRRIDGGGGGRGREEGTVGDEQVCVLVLSLSTWNRYFYPNYHAVHPASVLTLHPTIVERCEFCGHRR